ncbi:MULTISPECIES: hypothetical protein [Delftia]|nr:MULTISPECIES: hypothetical protein [Delftia]EPD35886.1 hypothetical protein HMPREF9702_05793 [Delftia acidovorans CCUG 15835]
MSAGMTIDQIIEAAAKAAGVPIRRIDDGWEVSFVDSYGEAYEPNIDNAQSFWLAAALRINVEHNHPADNRPWVSASVDGYVGPGQQFVEDVPDESQRADRMRLAILRCAAAQAPKEGV